MAKTLTREPVEDHPLNGASVVDSKDTTRELPIGRVQPAVHDWSPTEPFRTRIEENGNARHPPSSPSMKLCPFWP
jgi:hypothetical protein